EQIKYLSSYDVDDRFFFFLEERYGKRRRIIPSVSKKDLAAAIGTTPETLSRMLLRLKQEGLVTWEGKAMIINEKFWQRQEEKMDKN
ncbi:MAG: helix-turn-helix domain-containing protein, partial [Calditrichaeota bacterium]